MKNVKLYASVTLIIVALYLLMLLSLRVASNIERNIAMGYVERTCELIGNESGKWYECAK